MCMFIRPYIRQSGTLHPYIIDLPPIFLVCTAKDWHILPASTFFKSYNFLQSTYFAQVGINTYSLIKAYAVMFQLKVMFHLFIYIILKNTNKLYCNIAEIKIRIACKQYPADRIEQVNKYNSQVKKTRVEIKTLIYL